MTTTNVLYNSKEANDVINFICDTKVGKYTAQKPDLTQIIYTRMEIQENDVHNIHNDGFEDVVLYGMSY